jgi:DMSO/TMAO reductase YedYZ molybdopterin-dependent catalytic subunit
VPDVRGLTPLITPNARFYRVDTAFVLPQISAQEWRLRIHGMVDRQIEIDFHELLSRPLIERDIALTCVSNPVGGRLAGNARWVGVPLKPLLQEAGVRAAATQMIGRSPDGMTIGTPTAIALDGRDSMLAVQMNGQPLPVEHGFPVRMIVPGLYGYESATKWLVDLELTTEEVSAYWVQRGWWKSVPIKTESRIDTPGSGDHLAAGRIPVAGVAWAQHRGIERVEVRVNGKRWQDAALGPDPGIDGWRQWVWYWPATPGTYTIEARATDGAGATQTASSRKPFPSGATGWPRLSVTVS